MKVRCATQLAVVNYTRTLYLADKTLWSLLTGIYFIAKRRDDKAFILQS